jgi:hypothetical protein
MQSIFEKKINWKIQRHSILNALNIWKENSLKNSETFNFVFSQYFEKRIIWKIQNHSMSRFQSRKLPVWLFYKWINNFPATRMFTHCSWLCRWISKQEHIIFSRTNQIICGFHKYSGNFKVNQHPEHCYTIKLTMYLYQQTYPDTLS